jgi:hypothetical protein
MGRSWPRRLVAVPRKDEGVMTTRTARRLVDPISRKVSQLVRKGADERCTQSVGGEPLTPSDAATMRVRLAEPRQELVAHRDELVAAGLAYRRPVDLDPWQTELERFGVIDLVGDDDLHCGNREIGRAEEHDVDDVPRAELPFLGGAEHLSRNLLRRSGLAATLRTTSKECDRRTAVAPALDRFDHEPLRGEVDDALRAARRFSMVVVASLHVSCVEIDDGPACWAPVSAPPARFFRCHESTAFAFGQRYSEPRACGHG